MLGMDFFFWLKRAAASRAISTFSSAQPPKPDSFKPSCGNVCSHRTTLASYLAWAGGFIILRKKKKGKVLNRSVLYNFFAAHVKFTMFCLFASKADVDIIALK
jgi:hypothetical protein